MVRKFFKALFFGGLLAFGVLSGCGGDSDTPTEGNFQESYDNSGETLFSSSSETFIYSSAVISSSSSGIVPSSSISLPGNSNVEPLPEENDEMTDGRDGKNYRTVTIGSQTWMAENLNYDYNEGSAKSYCLDDKEENCDKYGRLYMWSAAMDSAAVFSSAGKGCGYGSECEVNEFVKVRGVCPEGWHLPNMDELDTLYASVGGIDVAGAELKSDSGWLEGGNGYDSFGFSALAGGYRGNLDNYLHEGDRALFWSSVSEDREFAYYSFFTALKPNAYYKKASKDCAFSVRCIKGYVSSSSYSSASSSSSSSIKDGSKYDASANRLTDLRDDQTYKTVTIGSQTWMAENLNYEASHSYCYNFYAGNCDKYGRLYMWSTAMDSSADFSAAGAGCGVGSLCNPRGTIRGICPMGWHLPNDDEWNELFIAVGGADIAGLMLKSTEDWEDEGNGSDEFGFSAYPAGSYEVYKGKFEDLHRVACMLSSSESGSNNISTIYFEYNYEAGYIGVGFKNDTQTVRCLKDSN